MAEDEPVGAAGFAKVYEDWETGRDVRTATIIFSRINQRTTATNENNSPQQQQQHTSSELSRIRNGESLKMSGGADIMSGRPDGLIAGVDAICLAVGDVLEISWKI